MRMTDYVSGFVRKKRICNAVLSILILYNTRNLRQNTFIVSMMAAVSS